MPYLRLLIQPTPGYTLASKEFIVCEAPTLDDYGKASGAKDGIGDPVVIRDYSGKKACVSSFLDLKNVLTRIKEWR